MIREQGRIIMDRVDLDREGGHIGLELPVFRRRSYCIQDLGTRALDSGSDIAARGEVGRDRVVCIDQRTRLCVQLSRLYRDGEEWENSSANGAEMAQQCAERRTREVRENRSCCRDDR